MAITPTSVAPVAFDPAQAQQDACKVIQIPFKNDLIAVVGEPISLLFKVSDTVTYRMTCPREYLITASGYCSRILQEDWNNKESGELDEINLLNHDVIYTKEHFETLSDYINTGFSTDREWSLADLKALYAISNFMEIKEIMQRSKKGVVEELNRNNESCLEFLIFGIRQTSSRIVGAALDILVRDYENKLESPPSKQYALNSLSLIKKSASLLKDRDKATRTVERAQLLFDWYLIKENKAKFKKLSVYFSSSDCRNSRDPSERQNFSKQLSKLNETGTLLLNNFKEIIPDKDLEDIKQKMNQANKLFQEYKDRLSKD